MSMLTVPVLCECLRDLVEWQIFAQYLPGIEQADISIIQKDKRDDLVEQKKKLYAKWLQVHPKASWDDVVKALENQAVRENAIARRVRGEYHITWTTFPSNKTFTSSDHVMSPQSNHSTVSEEISVSEDIVTELDTLQLSFVDLTENLKKEVEHNVKSGNTDINAVAFRVQQERAFSIPSLESVQTTDELFKAIHPHYNFLNCYLIVRIALYLCGVIAEKATVYNERIKTFMKNTKIKYLKNTLKHYCPQRFRACTNTTIVKIEVENGWGDQHLWLVKNLIETLFPVKHPDELPWYDIVHGSVIMTFIALEHMTPSLIESSRKKTEFMRLIGVISLKIGDELVWQREDGNAVLSFEESLIRATLADNIEVLQFILKYAEVNINTRNTNNSLQTKSSETGSMSINNDIENILKFYRAMYTNLMHDIEQVLQNMKKPSGHPDHEFLNSHNLSEISSHLPKPLSRQVEHYIQSLETIKKWLMIPDFTEDFLAKYSPTPFTGSIEVIICLHSVWSTHSVWYVEQLGQLIFTPTLFYQLQWFRVNRKEESVRVCLLADGKMMNILKECASNNEPRTSMLGVISIQVDDKVMITNDYSDGYTFHEAIELAKAIGDDKISDLLQQLLQNPAIYSESHYEVSSIDNNGNCSFHLHRDSTPLMIACCNDNSQLVHELLLDHNADPNIRNGRGVTALMYSTGNSEIFQMLLDHGAEHENIVTIYNESLIHFACIAGNVRVVKNVLQSSPLLNIQDAIVGNTPLILASAYNHAAVVEVLLQAGADPDIRTVHQQTAVQLTENEDIIDQLVKAKANLIKLPSFLLQSIIDSDLLLDNLDEDEHEEIKKFFQQNTLNVSNPSDELGLTLCMAISEGKILVAKALIAERNANLNFHSIMGISPLMIAIKKGYVELVQKLLQAQADPNIQNAEGATSLMIAYKNVENRRTLIQMLLHANADPNIMDGAGITVLTKACHNQDTEIVDILLQAKANPNIQDGKGMTPLMIACSKDAVELVFMLLQAGADPTIVDNKGKTALVYTGKGVITDMLFNSIYH